jgi:Zn-dependent protease with chaperone function
MIEGRYFPPNSAKALPARLWRLGDGLRLAIEGTSEILRPALASVTDPLGNVPRKATFADGGVFEAPAGADMHELLGDRRGFFARLARLELNARAVAVIAIATVGLLFAAYRFGIPLAASAAARVTPATVLEMMDRGTLEAVDKAMFSASGLDAANRGRVQRMFDELADKSGLKTPQLNLLFRKGGRIGANAFALPGGTIVITDELVQLAEKDDEIAGVLAHEIGHVEGRHSLNQIYRVLGIGFMIGVIGGDASQIVDEVIGQAVALQTLAYSRGFEADADRRSVELMVKAGRDPVAFVGLLDRIVGSRSSSKDGAKGGVKGTNWLSTHPGTADRRQSVSEIAKRLGWKQSFIGNRIPHHAIS